MFAQHERVKVIDSAPAAWYRRYCPCSTLSFRLFKDTARVSAHLKCHVSLRRSAWRWLTSFDRVAGICAEQSYLIVLPSAPFTVQNPESSDGMMCRKIKNGAPVC